MLNLCWNFMIYAILGWCCEVVYAAVTRGKFVNCGTMRGPYCPIYGIAVSLVILLLTPVADNLALLCICSFAITSLIEFIAGFALEKLIHHKWWDYSDQPFNVMGYVCLKMSLLWTIACVIIMRVVQPLLDKLYGWLYTPVIIVILCVFAAPFIVDAVFTIKGMIKLKLELELLDEMAAKIREVSEFIGEGLFDTAEKAIKIKEKTENSLEQLKQRNELIKQKNEQRSEQRKAALSAELEKLSARYEEKFGKSALSRFSNAFPEIRAISAHDVIDKIKAMRK